MSEARLRALQVYGARVEHDSWLRVNGAGSSGLANPHTRPLETCPHPDCLLVRSPLSAEKMSVALEIIAQQQQALTARDQLVEQIAAFVEQCEWDANFIERGTSIAQEIRAQFGAAVQAPSGAEDQR